jgi:NTP pyrophosphatase (non-canonical NTP hydrolase)
MNLTEYVLGALRTESELKGEFGFSDENSFLNPREFHAAMGLVTETAEFLDAFKKHIFYGKPLDKVHLLEEIGDMMWYVAILCATKGWDMGGIAKRTEKSVVGNTAQKVFSYSGLEFNGWLLHAGSNAACGATALLESVLCAQEGDDIHQLELRVIMEQMAILLYSLGSSFEDEAQRNHDKLKSRYPEKFTSEDALNRDLGKEREVLES